MIVNENAPELPHKGKSLHFSTGYKSRMRIIKEMGTKTAKLAQ